MYFAFTVVGIVESAFPPQADVMMQVARWQGAQALCRVLDLFPRTLDVHFCWPSGTVCSRRGMGLFSPPLSLLRSRPSSVGSDGFLLHSGSDRFASICHCFCGSESDCFAGEGKQRQKTAGSGASFTWVPWLSWQGLEAARVSLHCSAGTSVSAARFYSSLAISKMFTSFHTKEYVQRNDAEQSLSLL